MDSPTEMAMNNRQSDGTSDEEPLWTETREVQKLGNSFAIGLMSEFCKMKNIDADETVVVETYTDRYVIKTEE